MPSFPRMDILLGGAWTNPDPFRPFQNPTPSVKHPWTLFKGRCKKWVSLSKSFSGSSVKSNQAVHGIAAKVLTTYGFVKAASIAAVPSPGKIPSSTGKRAYAYPDLYRYVHRSPGTFAR